MEIFIMDETFKSLYNIDTFESFIWTERYNGCGNFEFYTPVNQAILKVVNTVQLKMVNKLDCYVWLKEAGSSMIIDSLEITTDAEKGNHLVISGRGLESLLERRIVWDRIYLNENLQEGIKRLLDYNVIDSRLPERNISNFLFSSSVNPYIISLFITAQYTGENLYDTILTICDTYKLGFNVVLDQNNNFVFSLVYGEDRSYDQEQNPYVVFSPKFDNIINSDYLESIKTLRNVALVEGEEGFVFEPFTPSFSTVSNSAGGETGIIGPSTPSGYIGNRRRTTVGTDGGMMRRELYVDARDIQSKMDDDTTLTEAQYNVLLTQRGTEKLAENAYTKAFTGEIEAKKMYEYGKDFFLGDVVQIVNEYNMETKVRVSEIVRVQDSNGYSMYPTFQQVS